MIKSAALAPAAEVLTIHETGSILSQTRRILLGCSSSSQDLKEVMKLDGGSPA
jgi:hypothetical protein